MSGGIKAKSILSATPRTDEYLHEASIRCLPWFFWSLLSLSHCSFMEQISSSRPSIFSFFVTYPMREQPLVNSLPVSINSWSWTLPTQSSIDQLRFHKINTTNNFLTKINSSRSTSFQSSYTYDQWATRCLTTLSRRIHSVVDLPPYLASSRSLSPNQSFHPHPRHTRRESSTGWTAAYVATEACLGCRTRSARPAIIINAMLAMAIPRPRVFPKIYRIARKEFQKLRRIEYTTGSRC